MLYKSPGSLNWTSFQINSCFFLSQDSHRCPKGCPKRTRAPPEEWKLHGALLGCSPAGQGAEPRGCPGPFLLFQSKMLLPSLWDILCPLFCLLRPLCLLTTPGNTAFLHTFVFFRSFPRSSCVGVSQAVTDDVALSFMPHFLPVSNSTPYTKEMQFKCSSK